MIIKEIKHGIACRVGDKVYLNEKLRKYPKLRSAIIKHELNHSSTVYSFKDISDDFGIEELKGLKKQYYTFILSNPSSWTEYLPLTFYNKKLVISPTMILFWISVLGMCFIIFKSI